MNHDTKITRAMVDAIDVAPGGPVTQARAAKNAIEDGTMKTDGRFVQMEYVGLDPGGCPLYRVAWGPEGAEL